LRAGTDGLCAAYRACAPLDAICIAVAIDRSVRCGVASAAEVQRAEADRTDAGGCSDRTLVDRPPAAPVPAALVPDMSPPIPPSPCRWRRATCGTKDGATSGYDASVTNLRPLSSDWTRSWRTSARVFSCADALEAMPVDASKTVASPSTRCLIISNSWSDIQIDRAHHTGGGDSACNDKGGKNTDLHDFLH
jgi:hypothetical protein